MTYFTATLGPKGQITLPKEVRIVLGTLEKGELVGFAVDEKKHSVSLKRMELKPAEEEYTEEELRKLLKLAHSKKNVSARFDNAKDALDYLDKL